MFYYSIKQELLLTAGPSGDRFLSINRRTESELRQAAVLTSLADPTPEGKSVVALAKEQGERVAEPEQAEFIAFNASTRISGLNLADGHQVRKGAMDAILKCFAKPEIMPN